MPDREFPIRTAAFTLGAVAVLLLFTSCVTMKGASQVDPLKGQPLKGAILDVHDPSGIARDNGAYYLFSTGDNILIHCSKDLIYWQQCGAVFITMPLWTAKDIPGASNVWAPDISHFNGKFHLYYAVSTFGSQRSDIGLATNTTLDRSSPSYDWVDEGKVIESGFSGDYNAIDPNLIIDAQGQPWLAFGSFWSGLKIVKIDPKTGKPDGPNPAIHSIASRLSAPDAIEASFVVYRNGYYYLFASYDFCCRGVNSTYNVRVGRSRAVTGPYVDASGTLMMLGGGTKILEGTDRWRGPGGESVTKLPDGKWIIIYHSYDATLGGTPTLRINTLRWDSAGWPHAAAFP